MSRIRFGLVGYGLFGKHHAKAIAACEETELVAIAVKSAESQAQAKEDHPAAEVVGDIQALLQRDDIGAVDVVVPNQMHFDVASQALNAGKHVLLEKPMALNAEHCRQLVELAKQKGLTLAVGHELRLSILWGKVKQLIDEGAIGRVQHVLVELSRFPYREGAEGWRYDIDRVGNWILEEPIHFFDLARWYLSGSGEPVSVYARANSRHEDHPELTDNFSAIINYADGAYGVVSQTLAAFGHHQAAKVTGTEGMIWTRWGAADARSDEMTFDLQYGLGDNVIQVSFDQQAGELLELQEEIRQVALAMRNGTSPPCTGHDGFWSTQLCVGAQKSVDTGQVVKFE